MERIIPWPGVGGGGARPVRLPIPVDRMLRIYFLVQFWFNLAARVVEGALCDSVAMRSFVGIDLGIEGVPDETMACTFRHLLDCNKLSMTLLTADNEHLHASGIKITRATNFDAAIIGAQNSINNRDVKRDPEMHQTAKSQQSYVDMKADTWVDGKTKLVHTVLASAANG